MGLKTGFLAKEGLTKRLVLGVASVATVAVIGATSFAGAAPEGKPTKAECEAAGFKNYGQCVKEWAHNKPGNGYGGGNNNTVNTEVNIDVSGDHNFITTVLHFVFG